LILVLVPDEAQGQIYEETIRPGLAPGNALVFAHGFAIRYGVIRPADYIDLLLLATILSPLIPILALLALLLTFTDVRAQASQENCPCWSVPMIYNICTGQNLFAWHTVFGAVTQLECNESDNGGVDTKWIFLVNDVGSGSICRTSLNNPNRLVARSATVTESQLDACYDVLDMAIDALNAQEYISN